MSELTDLQESVDNAEAIARMKETEGWKILEAHLNSQLEAYIADNAGNATDWNDYLKKAGKIFGIRLVLVDVEDFIRQGATASERIDELKSGTP